MKLNKCARGVCIPVYVCVRVYVDDDLTFATAVFQIWLYMQTQVLQHPAGSSIRRKVHNVSLQVDQVR